MRTSGEEAAARRGGAPRGRPRDPSRDDAILDAVVSLLADVGYSALRVEDVAARAAAGKATIYRRWPTKADLVVAALVRYADRAVPVPDTGALRSDLVQLLTTFASALTDTGAAIVTGVLSEARRDPDLREILRTRLVDRRRAAVESLLSRAQERGELPGGIDLPALAVIAPAMLIYQVLMAGESVDETTVRHVVDEVVLPLAVSGHPRDPRTRRSR